LEIYNNLTVEDVMKEGVVLLRNSKRGGYKVVLPMVYIHCLNTSFQIFPTRFDVVFKKQWHWAEFEDWDCQYQLIKNNTCLWLNNLLKDFQTDLGTLFNCKNQNREKLIQLSEIQSIAYEAAQFLKTKITASPQKEILSNLGTIPEKDFKFYSFRCATGNPSVDSRIFYEATPNDKIQKPWMVCRQYKHSVRDNLKLSGSDITEFFLDWKSRVCGHYDQYRCFYVVITNTIVSDDDIEMVSKYPEMSLICKKNFGKYCPLSFSIYSIFDDDPNQTKEGHFELVSPVEKKNPKKK
jgi:hypothetical protein